MAQRPVFVSDENMLVLVKQVEFEWFPGFAPIQKQRSISSLHKSAEKELSTGKILEISSKSTEKIGVQLSAFNLKLKSKDHGTASVESFFQGSKVFSNGGPYTDLYEKPSIDAKRDERLKNSGSLIRFEFEGLQWKLQPLTAFYDWLYIKALSDDEVLSAAIKEYQAFTDIEFNPEKSINCQARSAALFVSLVNKGVLAEALSSPERFIELTTVEKKNEVSGQMSLF